MRSSFSGQGQEQAIGELRVFDKIDKTQHHAAEPATTGQLLQGDQLNLSEKQAYPVRFCACRVKAWAAALFVQGQWAMAAVEAAAPGAVGASAVPRTEVEVESSAGPIGLLVEAAVDS